MHDKLLTNFVGGTAADVIHDEAADIAGFTEQGYLANLTPLLPKTLKASIPKDDLGHRQLRRQDHRRPVADADVQRLREHGRSSKQAGVKAPTLADPWTWAEFRAAAKKLTNSTASASAGASARRRRTIQTMSLNYGGQFNYLEKGKWIFRCGAAEQNVVRQMHDMIHVDKSVDPAATGLSGSGVLPAFFGGKCAMTVPGNFQAQGMIQQAPKGFNWAMFPLLKGRRRTRSRTRRRSRSPSRARTRRRRCSSSPIC